MTPVRFKPKLQRGRMPYKMIFTDDGGVITTYSGEVTDTDLLESGEEKNRNRDRVIKCHYAITDLSAVERFPVSVGSIKNNAGLSSNFFSENRDGLVVFVLPTDLEYGMARIWQAYADADGKRSKLCRTRAEAEAWVKKKLENIDK